MKYEEPFKLTVNAQHEFDLHPEAAAALDIVPDGEGAFHILHEGKSFHATLLEADYLNHQFTMTVNGVRFSVHVADHFDRLVKQLGLHAGSSQKANHIKAPMPGLVLNLLVEAGQKVEKGDALLILEAMKMENVIKAAGEGVVKSVRVTKGAAVDKGQLLIEME